MLPEATEQRREGRGLAAGEGGECGRAAGRATDRLVERRQLWGLGDREGEGGRGFKMAAPLLLPSVSAFRFPFGIRRRPPSGCRELAIAGETERADGERGEQRMTGGVRPCEGPHVGGGGWVRRWLPHVSPRECGAVGGRGGWAGRALFGRLAGRAAGPRRAPFRGRWIGRCGGGRQAGSAA